MLIHETSKPSEKQPRRENGYDVYEVAMGEVKIIMEWMERIVPYSRDFERSTQKMFDDVFYSLVILRGCCEKYFIKSAFTAFPNADVFEKRMKFMWGWWAWLESIISIHGQPKWNVNEIMNLGFIKLKEE